MKARDLDVYKIINEFVVYVDKLGRKPASIQIWVTAVKGYLRHLGIKIYSEDFKQMVKLPKKVRQREEPLTKEMIVRLLRILPMKIQTAVLVAVASGIRLGELVQLKISDVDFDQKPTRLRIRAEITKTREARETFLTSEATRALKDYLVRFFGWKEGTTNEEIKHRIIFGTTISRKEKRKLKLDPVLVAENTMIRSLKQYTRKIPELDQRNENGRKIIHFHAFRKFFRTVVGDAVGRDFAEALMGHHFYLDTYYNLPQEKRRETYLKAEPYLTISDFEKIERNLNVISEKQNKIEEDYVTVMQLLKNNSLQVPKSLERHFDKIAQK
jgi:integrase